MFGKDFMKKLQQAQEALSQMQEKLGEMRIEFTSGGGMVKVVMNGKKDIIDMHIDPQVVNPNDVEMLQDLIVAALNGASAKVKEELQGQFGDFKGMLGEEG